MEPITDPKVLHHTWLQFLVPLIIVMSITIISGTRNCSQVRLKEFLASLKIKSANCISTSQLPPLHSITVIPSINPLTNSWQLSLFLSQEISLISFRNRMPRPACPILPLVPSTVIVSLSSPHPSVISLTRHLLLIMLLLSPTLLLSVTFLRNWSWTYLMVKLLSHYSYSLAKVFESEYKKPTH